MATPGGKKRLKVLKAFRRKGPAAAGHRYNRWRTLGMTFSLAVLLVIPLSGMARVDLWGGDHRFWFRPAPLNVALAAVLAIFAAIYVVTFLSNVVAGRMFCGWGCPVGQLSRFGEAVDTPGLARRDRVSAQLRGALFSAALVLSSVVWWTDLRVFWSGATVGAAIAWGVAGALTLLAYLHGRVWRWSFCRKTCPIGLYYTFVSPADWYGVHFRNQQSTCIDCNLCDHVCPVQLKPRELTVPIPSPGGLSISDAPGRNHCLECGDCVRACEWIIAFKGRPPVPLKLGFHSGPKVVDVNDLADTA